MRRIWVGPSIENHNVNGWDVCEVCYERVVNKEWHALTYKYLINIHAHSPEHLYEILLFEECEPE